MGSAKDFDDHTPREGFLWHMVLLVLLVSSILVCGLLFQGWRDLNRTLTDRPDAVLLLNSGENLKHVISQLSENNWFHSGWQLRLAAWIKGSRPHLKAGEYRISNQSALGLLDAMVAGKVNQRFFIILPGWRWSDLCAALLQVETMKHTVKGCRTKDQENLAQSLGLQFPFLDGAFYPDTYAYIRNSQDVALLQRAHQKMIQVLEELWNKKALNLPLRKPEEALILASIIEKETGLDSDRPMISAALNNRLRINMKLEVDPTVIFGLGDQFDGDLTRRHLVTPGPYNTYLNRGLPPTPIAFPGFRSINAALNPASSGVFFFVARGDGTSQFSVTLKEHKAAVQKYQLKNQKKPVQ